ncbi:aminotransferase class I/II-fold pyridoxal phosphate-dependent enzyme [Escherichia coli]
MLDAGLEEKCLVSARPNIELYRKASLNTTSGLSICIWRRNRDDLRLPGRRSNGNVITGEDLLKLDALANQHGIPLVIDNAYGVRSGIVWRSAPAVESEYRTMHQSFQAGSTGSRCGIIIANERIITAITNINGVLSLAPGGIGPAMMCEMISVTICCACLKQSSNRFTTTCSGNYRHHSPLFTGKSLPDS